MSIDIRELFPDDLSDEAAYQLINFFYDFALAFEAIYLGKALRHEKAIINTNDTPDKSWKKKDIPDPPF